MDYDPHPSPSPPTSPVNSFSSFASNIQDQTVQLDEIEDIEDDDDFSRKTPEFNMSVNQDCRNRQAHQIRNSELAQNCLRHSSKQSLGRTEFT